MAKLRKRVPQTDDLPDRSTAAKKTGHAPASAEDLIARLAEQDRDLVRLLNDRARTLVKIAKCRKRAGQAPLVFAEETERINKAAAAGHGPLPREAIQAALREVVSGCRSLVRELRVAFLGPLYTYSHLAAISHFGQSVDLNPVGSIAAVFEEVNRGQDDFGLVP
ncbi:MAG: chorismate mutase, partial [Thermoguttaceae bacterium]